MSGLFVEMEYAQARKTGQDICGDAFFSQKIPEENRVVAALSDGLGSGVKANILASMTGTMALRFVVHRMGDLRSFETIMEALPVCQVRQISYATFSILDCTLHGATRLVEMGNPPAVLLRGGRVVEVPDRSMTSPRWNDRAMRLATIETEPQDRIVLVSDGITQAGLGNPRYPLGWQPEGLNGFLADCVNQQPDISARELCRRVLKEAVSKEPRWVPGDDMTVAVAYFRKPRRALVVTGPPFDKERDAEVARRLDEFDGRRIVCGGTTADIVARELNRPITTDLTCADRQLPPTSTLEGMDLVTEGILTLTRTAAYLEQDHTGRGINAAERLADCLRESDIIEFVVGTRINEAHQDPTLPVDLEIRRNIIKRIARVLEETYLKEVHIQAI
ncbi:MAG: SpoIIE family protein phosphatase [Planctomycetota bacterium]